jgi:hypothetical protein
MIYSNELKEKIDEIRGKFWSRILTKTVNLPPFVHIANLQHGLLQQTVGQGLSTYIERIF